MKKFLLISLVICGSMVLGMDKSGNDKENQRQIKHLIIDEKHKELSEFLKNKKHLIDSDIIALAHNLASSHHNANHPAVQTQMVVDIAKDQSLQSLGVLFYSE